MKYLFKKIEPKWQAKWEESKVFEAKDNSDKPKFYGLVEFPYPSGAGILRAYRHRLDMGTLPDHRI